MPVQVNEVVVRTTVDTKTPCLPFEEDVETVKDGGSDEDIVERVLEILRERRER